MNKLATTAIIPARGGSKGVARKNLRTCNGVPLIVRCIRTALAGGCERVIVSTDDDDIAGLALTEFAEVRLRPGHLCGDATTSEAVIVDAIHACDVDGVVVFLQCTNPLTLPKDVQRSIELVQANPLSVAMTASPTYAFLWEKRRTGAEGINHCEYVRQRRQEIEPQWRETGAVYCFQVRQFLRSKHRFCGPVAIVEQQQWQAVDIDTEDDLVVANALARKHDPPPNLSRIKCVVLDFDGTLTDRMVWTDSSGNESIRCSKEDSTGIFRLKHAGIRVLCLTHEDDRSVVHRCKKLDINLTSTKRPKEDVIAAVVSPYSLNEVAFIGDDFPDAAAMQLCGLSVCPADATQAAKDAADVVLTRNGGDGAVRELCEMLLAGRKT